MVFVKRCKTFCCYDSIALPQGDFSDVVLADAAGQAWRGSVEEESDVRRRRRHPEPDERWRCQNQRVPRSPNPESMRSRSEVSRSACHNCVLPCPALYGVTFGIVLPSICPDCHLICSSIVLSVIAPGCALERGRLLQVLLLKAERSLAATESRTEVNRSTRHNCILPCPAPYWVTSCLVLPCRCHDCRLTHGVIVVHYTVNFLTVCYLFD
ncbi:uncharacterized protein LOC128903519 isoform X2 [Rissa tridactyla]|uniref:uncharacterized protein LOC128903519 isoform X2 n=1 Tax=Rissa tridactyla TaxID=75485 RepID=UPI0023BACBAB|nr:uncharacterized protein LOC128903519 isoform X2 [Rissa tridactyla]